MAPTVTFYAETTTVSSAKQSSHEGVVRRDAHAGDHRMTAVRVTVDQPYLPCGHAASEQIMEPPGGRWGWLDEIRCGCGAGYVCVDQNDSG